MKRIGLIGGISWTSTLYYYKYINEGINQKFGGLESAECVIYSLNFAEIQSKGWTNSFEMIHEACKKLIFCEVDCIVLCANTAHLFADEIQSKIDIPIIHIVTATTTAIKAQNIKNVALLGTKFTMEMSFYREKLEENGLNLFIPEQQEDRDLIHFILKEELGRGLIKEDSKEILISISENLLQQGAEGIILGCTEIPLLINQENFSVPVFDTTLIHAQAAIDFALS